MDYTFAVITRVPDPDKSGGNLAVAFGLRVDPQALGGDALDPPRKLADMGIIPVHSLWLRAPVFELGEIVILDGTYGREVAGRQRKPHKWDVDVEHFNDLEEAVHRAENIYQESQRD